MKRAVNRWARLCGAVVLAAGMATAQAADLQALLAQYRTQGVREFSAEAGKALWLKEFDGNSCASCHTGSPRNPGRHDRTGKAIEPMAPSVNPDRLTDSRKIKKWLLRNCKSTLHRECTGQEKGDVLTWLRLQ